MPVYHVTHVAPNGNRISRPVVACCATDARNMRDAELGLDDAEAEGFTVEVIAVADPDRGYERGLVDAEARRIRNEAWR